MRRFANTRTSAGVGTGAAILLVWACNGREFTAADRAGGAGSDGGGASSGQPQTPPGGEAGEGVSSAGRGGAPGDAECGDGLPEGDEGCDDGNETPSDGCSASCSEEPGWSCVGKPSMCAERCGDGSLDSGEDCDDRNLTPRDGCDESCNVEAGWACSEEPSTCVELCGNGNLDGGEDCDDQNGTSLDGCSSCRIENGWTCSGTPSICTMMRPPPSCDGLATSCQAESCCTSILVPGDETFPLGDDTIPDGERNTTVSGFLLDKYEVSVGRFRKFVDAYDTWRSQANPEAGAGAHALIGGSGWQNAWTSSLPDDAVDLAAAVKCEVQNQTWTDAAAGNEHYPINCMSWYIAFAFCAWDQGRLPTELEWEYATAGGGEDRTYAWGPAAPDDTRAVYCGGSCSPFSVVGSKAAGAGRWGHRDLAGSVYEWALDLYVVYPPTVNRDYANIASGPGRVVRGGGWNHSETVLGAATRFSNNPAVFYYDFGMRCARNR